MNLMAKVCLCTYYLLGYGVLYGIGGALTGALSGTVAAVTGHAILQENETPLYQLAQVGAVGGAVIAGAAGFVQGFFKGCSAAIVPRDNDLVPLV